MVDDELRTYIHGLLKQGYHIDDIRKTLLKAGHDMGKVEELSSAVFELFHSDLLKYIDQELSKGRGIDLIRQDLLKLGHAPHKLHQVIDFHKKKHPLLKRLHLNETIQAEKKWFGSWFKIYGYLFVAVLVVFGIVALVLMNLDDAPASSEEQVQICSGVVDPVYAPLCIALANSDSSSCVGSADIPLCEDLYYMYTFYRSNDRNDCSGIANPSVKELCYQIVDQSCNNFLGYGDYCESIRVNDPLACKTNTPSAPIKSCADNYNFYRALRDDNSFCALIVDAELQKVCDIVSA